MILCSGCFDGLHSGHVRYLQAARKFCEPGEPLYVAVAPDDYIRAFKGREPRWSQTERVETLRALKVVSAAFHEVESTAETIRYMRPRLFVKGCDWKRLPDDICEALVEVGASFKCVDTPGRHSSDAFAVHPV